MMTEQPCILTVSHNRRNLELLTQFLNRDGFDTLATQTLEDLNAALNPENKFTLALIDIAGFDNNIWTCCETLSSRGVPLLVVTNAQSSALRQTGILHGVQSILTKPLIIKELMALIHKLHNKMDT